MAGHLRSTVESRVSPLDDLDSMDEKNKPAWAWSPIGSVWRGVHSLPSVLVFLLPSFVANRFRSGSAAKPKIIHPTSYLDGLRGVAAFIVYIYHFSIMWSFPDLETGYGSPESTDNFYQLPFIRLLFAGRASVLVFFIISGYVLSMRTLNLIYRGQHNKALEALSSSVFRRPFRLYLPIIVATGILSLLVQTIAPFREDWELRSGVPHTADNIKNQFYDWWGTIVNLVNPFVVDGSIRGKGRHAISTYISPLWTIPIEFRGSLAVFLLLLAFARSKRWIPLAATFCLGVVWQLQAGNPDMALFCAGIFFAELCLIIPPFTVCKNLQKLFHNQPARVVHVVHHAIIMILFIAALFLLSCPLVDPGRTPGFGLLSRLTPAFYKFPDPASDIPDENQVHLFWLAVGSILLIFTLMYSPPIRIPTAPIAQDEEQESIPLVRPRTRTELDAPAPSIPNPPTLSRHEPLLQRLFTNRVSQYLGFTSYSLYMVHDAVNHVIGVRYAIPGVDLRTNYWAAAQVMSPEDLDQFTPLYWKEYRYLYTIGFFWNTLAVIWLSDIFTRAVDIPCVRLARSISKLVEGSGES